MRWSLLPKGSVAMTTKKNEPQKNQPKDPPKPAQKPADQGSQKQGGPKDQPKPKSEAEKEEDAGDDAPSSIDPKPPPPAPVQEKILKAPTVHDVSGDGSVMLVSWSNVTENDDCNPVSMPRYPVKSVQVTGDFGGNAAVAILGSNDGQQFFPLSDRDGAIISIRNASLTDVLGVCMLVKPDIVAGSNQNLAISMLFQVGSSPLR